MSTDSNQRKFIDEKEIVRSLRIITRNDPDAVVEVRGLEIPRVGTMYGYFSPEHFCELPQLLKPYIGLPGLWYVTINPVMPALLARCANRLERAGKGSSTPDKYITCRKWLFVDVDPERPAGISSTDDEKAAAWDTMQCVVDWMKGTLGFAAPLLTDSGNGYHALFHADMPNDEISMQTVKSCLRTLSQKFSSDRCKIDEATFNASRVTKLYGTMAQKGSHCPEIGRPHRLSRILEVPKEFAYDSQ